jgi:hypothetical protein
MKLYELKIEDEGIDEVYAISLVESPAIESDWIFLNKDEVAFAKVDTEQRILVGAVLIPEKHILRVDGEGNPYHVFFSKETVKKLAQNYLMKKYNDSATLEHDKKIKGVHLVESWIKDGKLDKSNGYGLNLPEGSWVGIMKVTDDKIWNEYVKTGRVKGFSVEALLESKLVKASQEIDLDKNLKDLTDLEANILLGQIKAIIKQDNRYKGKKRVDMESYSDYPDAVKNAAKRVLDWVEENGWGSCGTPVGKQRANQLAKGEPISVDTIKRMYSYVSRHEVDLETSKTYNDGCGKLMMDAWGGLAAGRWAKSKLRELGLLTESKEGVPHYTADGKLYTGPTHKDASGRLMTGATHTEDSEYLYHIEELEANPLIIAPSYAGEPAKIKKKKDDTKHSA